MPRRPRTSQLAQGHSGGASQSEQQRAPDWNPLANLSAHRSRGWKKDLNCYMGAYFRLNYRHEPASKWPELKTKFFKFLIDHHSEWKAIRNNDPLGYLPYMEAQFERVTGYKLVGLGTCTEWIHAGSYYHWVVAQQGQLGRCPRLAGVPPPQGPMTPPPFLPVMAVASTQASIPDPPWGGADDPEPSPNHEKGMPLPQVSKAPPGIRGVLETPPPRVAEPHLESPALHGAPPKNVIVPSLGGGIPARRFRSPSRNTKADSRPFGCCMKRPENTDWPLK